MPFQIESGFDPGAILARQEMPPDAITQQARALALKNQQNEQSLFPLRQQEAQLGLQEKQLQMQQQQFAMQDQQKMRGIMTDSSVDWSKPESMGVMINRAAQAGVSPQMIQGMLKENADYLDKFSQSGERQQKIHLNNLDQTRGELQAIHDDPNYGSPDTQRKYQAAVRRHIQAGDIQPGQVPDQLPADKEALVPTINGLAMYSALATEAQKKAEAAKAGEEAKKATAEAGAATALQGLREVHTPGAKAESDIKVQQANALKSMNDQNWQDYIDRVIEDKASPLYRRTVSQVQFYRQQGNLKAADDAVKAAGEQLGKTESAVATAKATAPIKIDVAAATQGAAANAAAEGGGLDLMAEQALNGQFTSRNPQLMAKVYNRAAELAKDRGLSNQQVLMERNAAHANQAAFTAVTKQYETLKPFAEMAEKNANILEEKAKDIADVGVPILNMPIRVIQQRFAGNTKVAAFIAALQPVQADFARILNSPTGGGVLSDQARSEMQGAISPSATPGQIKAALDVFRQDAKNRRESYEASLADLKGKTIVGNQQEQKATHRFNPATGKIEVIQ